MKPQPKKKLKTIGKLKAELQEHFNRYIRNRDEGKPCISCGIVKKLQAGHFYPVSGWDGLRFDEDNVFGECEYDNCFNEGHLITYSKALKERIGEERFSALEKRAEDYKRNGNKWNRTDLMELIEYYKSK